LRHADQCGHLQVGRLRFEYRGELGNRFLQLAGFEEGESKIEVDAEGR
jgi:hypothetical protein